MSQACWLKTEPDKNIAWDGKSKSEKKQHIQCNELILYEDIIYFYASFIKYDMIT